jgi:hypothetical protein
MNEKSPENVFKIKTSESKLPERAAEEISSNDKNEQSKIDLKVPKKELTLDGLMEFLQKNNLQPNEKIIEKYYKEILDYKKDQETILNTVKSLESKREEFTKEVENDPNNSEILKKLQELNGSISDLNTSEYIISDNIKNIVKNITNESETITENNENISNNNILNQNLYKFLTDNLNETIKNENTINENEQKNIENVENLNLEKNENDSKNEDFNTLKQIEREKNQNIENQNIENTKNEEKNLNNVFEKNINNTETNNFNSFSKEKEFLPIDTSNLKLDNGNEIYKPDFLQKEYNDSERMSLNISSLENNSKPENIEENNNKKESKNYLEKFETINGGEIISENNNPEINETKYIENDFENLNPISDIDTLKNNDHFQTIDETNEKLEDINPIIGGNKVQESLTPSSEKIKNLENLKVEDNENKIFDNINPVNDLTKDTNNEMSYEKDIIPPDKQYVLNSILNESGDMEKNTVAENDLEDLVNKMVDDDSVKQTIIEEPKLKEDGIYNDIDSMTPIADSNNSLENLNPAISDTNEALKIKEPDFILEETKKTNNLIESLSRIMIDGFNGLMNNMGNMSNGQAPQINESFSSNNKSSESPNPKIIQPNWITGYRDGMRKGTGVSTALGYDTKLRGDNMGLYI